MNRIKSIIAVLAFSFALSTGTALAEQPAVTVYGSNPGSGVLDDVATPTPAPADSGTAPTTSQTPNKAPSAAAPSSVSASAAAPSTETQQASSGSLPFTGAEAGLVAIAGLALVAGGFAMRKFSQDRS